MKRILIIQLARFGDLVQTKRLLTTFLAESDTEVHLCLDNSLNDLAEIIYPSVNLHPIVAHGTGMTKTGAAHAILVENRNVFRILSEIGFDLVVNLNYSGLNFRLAALFDPTIVRGYKYSHGQEIKGTWPDMAMRWSRQRRTGINLVDFWAGYADNPVAPQDVNPEAVPGGQGIGVVMAGRETRRSLPTDVLVKIIAAIWEKNGKGRVTLLGSQTESRTANLLLKKMPRTIQSQATDLTGKTNWSELVDVVNGLDLLITPDTGTMHLAAHLGTPVMSFFLSSAWCFETGPYGLGHIVFQADTECLPCLESEPCPYEIKCLKPFATTDFIRFLSTMNSEHAPKNMLALNSGFDNLGGIFTTFAGTDEHHKARNDFREFIARHVKVTGSDNSSPNTRLAEMLYLERDWMTEN